MTVCVLRAGNTEHTVHLGYTTDDDGVWAECTTGTWRKLLGWDATPNDALQAQAEHDMGILVCECAELNDPDVLATGNGTSQGCPRHDPDLLPGSIGLAKVASYVTRLAPYDEPIPELVAPILRAAVAGLADIDRHLRDGQV